MNFVQFFFPPSIAIASLEEVGAGHFVRSPCELPHDKTNKMSVRPAASDQPGHGLIRVFAVRSMGS